MSEIQQRTAEQLFRTLGELKGGAMKFGQALSVLEAALPDELAAPYRAAPDPAAGLRSADADPDRARRSSRATSGPDWQERPGLARRRPDRRRRRSARCTGAAGATAARSRSRCSTPAPGDALQSDLRQLARLARTIGPLVPGIEIKPLVAELQARAAEELDYHPRGRGPAGLRRCVPRRPRDRRPRRGRASATTVLVTEWLESPASLASIIAERHPGGARPLRRALRAVPLRRARPAPACCTPTRTPGTSGCSPADDGAPGRLGVLDYGAVARLPERRPAPRRWAG